MTTARPTSVAFTSPISLPSPLARLSSLPKCSPRRPRSLRFFRITSRQDTDASVDGDGNLSASTGASTDADPPLFASTGPSRPWDNVDVGKAFAPITDDEKAALRAKLPKRVANFLIRRADDAVAQRESRGSDDSFFGRVLRDLPPDVPDWETDDNGEFKNYVYETSSGPPAFRRRGSSLFGGGDGLPDTEDSSLQGETKKYSLFVGNVGSVDEQASQVGYSLLFLLGGLFLFKLLAAIVSFFVSFTFSFLAIFALSAGIFVVFFLLRF